MWPWTLQSFPHHFLRIENPYARQKAAIIDAKKIAATYNLLKEKNIDSIDVLDKYISNMKTSAKHIHDEIRDLEGTIAELTDTIKYAERINEYQPIWNQYLSTKKSDNFRQEHRTEIMLYEAAQNNLKRNHPGKVIKLQALKQQKENLEDKKYELQGSLSALSKEKDELLKARKNVEILLNISNENQLKEQEKDPAQQEKKPKNKTKHQVLE